MAVDAAQKTAQLALGAENGPADLDEVIEAWTHLGEDTAVPEPTTLAIWGVFGALGLIAARRRRKAA